MSVTGPGLEKGVYAFSSHCPFVSGDVIDVFVGRWEEHSRGRVLIKCQTKEESIGGDEMCVIQLRRPLTLDEYRESHHPLIRPLIHNRDEGVSAVLIPCEMVRTIPDTFPDDMEIA